MKNQKIKKMLAGMLAATMVLGMGITALAQTGTETGTGTGTGTGSFEGHVDKDVVAVTLPTADATTFSYKMDPEGLIAATNKDKYPDASFEEGKNVYFLSGEDTWTSDSAKLKVVNKGTVDVDVTVVAKTAANDKVSMATSDTFAENDTAAKLYLGLKVADKAAVAVDTTDTAGKVVVGLRGNEDNYEVTSTDSGYAYTAKSGVPDTAWNSFEFGMTGACNPNGDYSAEGLAGSDVTVTWSYAVRAEDSANDLLDANAVSEAAPSIATTSYQMTANTPIDISVNLGGGDLAATAVSKVMDPTGVWDYVQAGDAVYDANSKKLTLKASMVDACIAADVSSIIVIFDDSAQTSVTVNLTK